MWRTLAVFSSLLCISAAAAFLIACGNSSSGTSKSCTGSYNIVGDWQGTATSGSSSDNLVGVINSSGSAAFFDGLADIVTVSGLTGACSFSETLNAYASIESGIEQTTTGTVTGNVTSNSSITGSDVSNGGTTSLTFNSYSPISSESSLSGTLTAVAEGQVDDLLSLSFGGTSSSITFSGSDANGCTVNGTLSQETASSALVNVYDMTFDVSGTSCTLSGNYTGIGFQSSADLLDVNGSATGTYLYGIVTSISTPFVVEVIPALDERDHASHDAAAGPRLPNVFGFSRHSK